MLKKILGAAFLMISLHAADAQAFCGFYVAKADTKLFNKASKVVLVREEDKTVITMANDFEGDVKDFAIVIPVPTFIEEGQIHVTENKIIDHLDAYTAPRLVEYFDGDPCQPKLEMMFAKRAPAAAMMEDGAGKAARAKSLGVTIEAEYRVGEYDIVILSAKESDGLATFLTESGYKIPDGAEKVLESYIKQKTRFFLAKVNLEEHTKSGRAYLRPIQVAYESPKFMLPIRLGTVNAKDSQELFIFTITRKGRVEPTNYRSVKLPSGMDIPLFVKNEFGDFYRAMFDTQVKKEEMRAVFLEYAWDMNWCDPCAADPLSPEELRELGAFWIDLPKKNNAPGKAQNGRRIMPQGFPSQQLQARDAFVTRMHLRYTGESFPEDLMFQETTNRENFQARYVLRHPWTGEADQCSMAGDYFNSLPARFEKEAKTLANLTGWDIGEIRSKMDKHGQKSEVKQPDRPWWERLWH